MAVDWTNSAPGLLIPLDRKSAEPLGSQLEGWFRDSVRSGRLQSGERLPSTRELAKTLGVSRGLVVQCFEQLHAEGYLTARAGSATRVANASRPAEPLIPARTVPSRPAIDFVPALPDLTSFPRKDWIWALTEATRDAPSAGFGYSGPVGPMRFCEVLAGYLTRVRGAVADPGRIVTCTGFAQGLVLTLQALAARGVTRIGFEDPGYQETGIIAASAAGIEVVPVPVDEQGVVVQALADTGAQAVVLTPAHQWPTGVLLSPARRHALAVWAETAGGWVVEDDYDAEFRYDHPPIGVLQGLVPERVILIGTVSKSLAPALRIGWVVCPVDLVEAIGALKVKADRGSPVLDQLALARLIESGRFDRHLRLMRKVYLTRRNVLVEALDEHAPGVRVSGLAAGFHAVAHLPAGLGETAVITAAAARGVGLYGMSTQRSNRAEEPAQLVLGFGTLSERTIQAGIAAVAPVLSA
jgi:GntR family transcriptional regulator/MocR family aminotransferase